MKSIELRLVSYLAAVAVSLVVGRTCMAAEPVTSVEQAYKLLHAGKLSDDSAKSLEAFVEKKYKGQDLTSSEHRHLLEPTDDGGYALWGLACASKDSKVTVFAEKGRSWPMVRLGDSDLWVAAEKFGNFNSVHYRFDVDGVRLPHQKENRFGFESYEWLPDSLKQDGVPTGELIDLGKHVGTKYFPGAERKWSLYVPAQYASSSEPAKLIVFNDGGGFCKGDGNACIVLDNLIHQKKIPVMLALFVDPGTYPPKGKAKEGASNRSNEYDTCTPRFASFLDEELLPQIREKYRISDDPWDHAICGSSSGGSCAFTAAWHRNDLFRRVISFVGSFCDFRQLGDFPEYGDSYVLAGEKFGEWKTAHDYPSLLRKTNPRKPLKVFLQDGENDLDNNLGNWFLANQQMSAGLAFGGYDYKFVPGRGMHSKKHGMSILPEILVWMWNDDYESN